MGSIRDLIWEEDAVGVVEIILILVVLIGLVVIFKEQLVSLVKDILDKITKQSKSFEFLERSGGMVRREVLRFF